MNWPKVFTLFKKLPDKLLDKRFKNFILIPLAVFVSFGLFYFMSVLISQDQELKESSENIGVDFLLNVKKEDLELRSRRRPKKPDDPEPPPETPKLKVQAQELEKPVMNTDLPPLDLPEDFKSDPQGAGVAGGLHQNQEVAPIFRIQPSYPRRAALEGIEGFVILKFDITETGQTANISVLQASPPQIFNSSAIQALKQWKYKAKQVEGKAVRQNNLKVQLDFNLQ